MASTNDSTREENVFKPHYPLRIRMSVILYPIGVVACIFFIYMAIASHAIIPYAIYAIIFGFTVLSMPMIIFREVRFGETIILKRYFLPPRIIQYEDVTDFTLRGLVARHGGIPLANVQNRSEFEKIIRRLVARNKINFKK
ncbi:MAG: hypothetical protein ABSA23_03885 [Anaerolineales bacterium]|jgi:hypothetical protein